jgi:hypothetical protein
MLFMSHNVGGWVVKQVTCLKFVPKTLLSPPADNYAWTGAFAGS